MTILPAKRTTAGPEDKNDNSANGNTERARREHSAHSSGINESSKSGTRRPFRRSASPETTDHCLRKRFKESSKPPRRKQTRERKNNRVELPPEESHDTSNNAPPTEQIDEVDVTSRENDNKDSEDGTGFNSEDEYTTPLRSIKNVSDEDWTSRDALFARCIAEIGYEIKQINEDGACLFRAIADQIFGDQELHYMVRTSCMDYIVKNRDFFAAYVTEDFDKYVARKRKWNVHGNHLEIQAMSEMYNRTIEVYCYQIEPINIFNGPTINADEPIRLSYHRMCHYNSISNPNKPSVGVGLGLPAYHTIDLNRRRMVDAVRASEELLIEQTMLEDKLKATDWEATNEALEEEVARESYIQYFRDAEKRLKPQGHAAGSSSTITSAVCSSPRSSTRRGSASPKGSMSPKGSSSPKSSSFTSLRLSPRSSSTVTSCQPIDYSGNSSPSLVSENAEMHFSHIPVSNQSTTASSLFDYDGRCKLNFDFGTLNEGEDSLKKDAAGSTKKSVMESDLMNEDDWDDGIMAQVLAESRKTYLDDLKKNTKKLGSPGPSTSR